MLSVVSHLKGSEDADPSHAAVAGAELQVRAVSDDVRDAWDAYVRESASHSLYHLYAWRDVIRTVFGGETRYLAAYSGERIAGVLPLGRLNSLLFGNFLVSLPYFNYGGVLADNDDVARVLWSSAVKLAQKLGCSHVELRHDRQQFPDVAVRTDKVSMLLSLPQSSDALTKQLPAKLRSQIKRPQREGASCVNGGSELLDEFYTVFAQNMRDLGTPVYDRKLFAAILRTFPEHARLFIVHLADQPVAAAFVIGHNGMMEIPWASSLRAANNISVNMLLYWEVLKYSADHGYRVFDFGRSTADSGTFKFKKQWGAEPKQLYWHYWMKDGGGPPKINHSNPKYQLLIAAWQRLPLPIANWLGPKLIKHLP